jgi:hypothetical protein
MGQISFVGAEFKSVDGNSGSKGKGLLKVILKLARPGVLFLLRNPFLFQINPGRLSVYPWRKNGL